MTTSEQPSPFFELGDTTFQRIAVLHKVEFRLHGKHLLLTGATGFFGKWLLRLLALMSERGVELRVTAVSREPEAFLSRNPEYRNCSWLSWVHSDMRLLGALELGPVDYVLHAAADTSAAAHKAPLELFDSITNGARGVLDAAVFAGAQRILFTGSGAQYGPLAAGHPISEDSFIACDTANVASAYAEAKRFQEILGVLYAEQYGVDVILTRCFAFSGPGLPLNGHFAIGNFVRDALEADAIVLTSSGTAVRSYLHGADLAVWLLTLLVLGESRQAYNVGSDQAISIADLARKVIARIAPEKPLRILGKADDGLRSFYVPDITKARTLGLDVWTNLDMSIDSMATWALQH